MSAWYIDTWVKAPTPVTSPTAHTPSVTRQMAVDGQALGRVVDTDARDVERGEVGPSSRGDEEPLAGDGPGPVELEHERRRRPGARRDAGRGVDRHPVAAERLGHEHARLGLLDGQQPVGILDDRHVGAEPGEHLPELDTDGPAPEHDQ